VLPAVRRGHIVWLILIFVIVTVVLAPVITHAGEWLYDLRRNPTLSWRSTPNVAAG
jgi:hypothetical protein